MGSFKLDNVVVHVDSSPPVVSDIRMIGNEIDRPAVHGSKDLFTMSFTFDAFDEHSGLFTIHWQLYDMADNSIIHDTDNVAVRKSDSADCSTPECICIPNSLCYFTNYNISFNEHEMNISQGNHDHDYVLAVTVTNNASLETTKTFQITIDISPPLEGHVHDSSQGQPDLDYQQEYEIFASWDGFFDRESGIIEYGYFFGHDCLDDTTSINLPLQLPVSNKIVPG
ncbi:uncharacterized protein [Ptychodera flava]|uniref:uncharacterized protein n=1 Tax=Ptychodera flava TaxID=63121 RepID=UPI00396AA216